MIPSKDGLRTIETWIIHKMTPCLDSIAWKRPFASRFGFRSDEYGGPALVFADGDTPEKDVSMEPISESAFQGEAGGLHFRLAWEYDYKEDFAICCEVFNPSSEVNRFRSIGLRLGLDTYMATYPGWNDIPFSTLLRCERTHFFGYFMKPSGAILCVASPDPISSWRRHYNIAPYGDGGHRIYTVTLDLLHEGPLPSRHPGHPSELTAGERRSWTIRFRPAENLAGVPAILSDLAAAPFFDVGLCTGEPGRSMTGRVCLPGGEERVLNVEFPAEGESVVLRETHGGRVSEARLHGRRPWSWYLQNARREALRVPQKASTHAEGWLGLYTLELGALHFPDPEFDRKARERSDAIIGEMFDLEEGCSRYQKPRVMNTAYMAGLFALRHRNGGDARDLEIAGRMTDFVFSFQNADGALLGSAGRNDAHIHYSAVAYPLKSLMEVMLREKDDPQSGASFRRHLTKMRKAVDDLVRCGDNIETEGEMTFEDGMISCSFLQIAMFALYFAEPAERPGLIAAAEDLFRRHCCLQQRLIPDERMRGCTLRFWESQYDVLLSPNMMNSPHGWTSWKTYGTYYLYLLTGNPDYLRNTLDTLGSCMRAIDPETGTLRWGFISDPRVEARQFGLRSDYSLDGKGRRVAVPEPENPANLEGISRIVGEEYIDMVSDHYPGWCCDNDVHEHFKCLEEVALTASHVLESSGGEIESYNAVVHEEGEVLVVTPSEPIVTRVHLNLAHPRAVRIARNGEVSEYSLSAGKVWLDAP